MPQQRDAHVKRVFQTDSAGTINQDIWVDVLRIDMLPVSFGSREDGVKGQGINQYFLWNDDVNNPLDYVDGSKADAQGENANAARKTEQLKIKNPDTPDDSATTNLLWIIDQFGTLAQGKETGQSFRINFVFDDAPADGSGDSGIPPAPRQVSVMKVVNNDLAGASMTNADGTSVLMDWQTYVKALQDGTTDSSQYLNVEFTEQFTASFGADEMRGYRGQNIVFVLGVNQVLETLFAAGDPTAVDGNGVSLVVRTDPLQTIVNVGFGGLAVIFGPQANNAPPFRPPPKTRIEVDELSGNAVSAAS